MAPMPPNDAMFLLAERREQPMHVGGLQLFDFPPGAGDEWLQELYQRTITSDPSEVSPLFRRRPVRPATSLGAWTWEEDPDIDLEHHIRHSALPRPGRIRELLGLASRLHGTLLDRHRPLWEAHLIEGLEGNRFAVYSKIHHSLLDGVSALRLLSKSLSTDPDVRDMPMPWSYRPPQRPDADPDGLSALLKLPVSALKAGVDVAALGPRLGRAAIKTLIDSNSHLPKVAPRSVLNQPITGARRFAAQSWPIARFRAVADATGTTLNDVILAACSGALRAYLLDMEALPDDSLIAMTPVSLRSKDDDVGGNAVGALLCELGTDRAAAEERLEVIHGSMETGKSALRSMNSTQATLVSAAAMSPMLLGQIPGLRRVASPGYNIVISNIPGPNEPLYWNGARLLGIYPMSIPTDGQALNITVTSYDGDLEFGLTGCRRTAPHLQRLLSHLESAVSELEAAAGKG